MGKQSKRRAATKPASKPGAPAAKPRQASKEAQVESLLEQGQELIANEDYEQGLAHLRQAFAIDPKNPEVAELLGSALAEFGDPADAVKVLKQSIILAPEDGFEKYMYLGQLVDGPEACECFRRGVALMEREAAAAAAAGEPADPELASRIASGLCALVEGLLTYAAKPDDVAAEAEALLLRAGELDPRSPEPPQALAALRASQERTEEALEALRRSVACWLPAEEDPEAMDADGAEDAAGTLPDGAPGYEFRLETAKLLLDLDDSTEAAVRVLEGLIEERDTVPDAWFLLALAHHGACKFKRARENLDHAEELAGKVFASPAEAEARGLDFANLRAAIDASEAAWKEDGLECNDDDDDEDEDGEDVFGDDDEDDGEAGAMETDDHHDEAAAAAGGGSKGGGAQKKGAAKQAANGAPAAAAGKSAGGKRGGKK